MMNYPKYESYKDSGIDWLGEIPSDWKQQSNKYIFKLKKTLVGNHSSDYVLLSLTLKGIIERDMENPEGKFPAEFNTYQIVEKNDFVFCLFDVEETPRTVGLSEYNGMITGAYTVMEVSKHVSNKYFYYFYLNLDTDKRLKSLYTGLRNTISKDSFFSFKSFVPPIQEQTLIAKFLDQKTSQIDEAIRIKEKQIELLKEQKQIMIQNAVTKGLDPNVKMKDSGVDWIGEIPEHWEVKRAKYLFTEVDERSKDGSEELLSVSHMTGVTPRSEKNVSMFMSEDYTGSKLCKHNDLVINIMWAWMGALGVSNHKGIVSPSYGVFRQKQILSFHPAYLEFLLKTTKYIEHYNQVSTGLHSSRLRFYGHMFFAMKMGYPSYQEQEQIVNFLTEKNSETNNYIDVLEKQIEKLKEYKTTLINSAVTGKIKVTPEMVGEA
ncbi:restriction endonuclease subunit S [Wohlfahrtiimonas chitiniclastica]|uniref:Restriction endonuclease subunit S n=1 Tax=Wohlfahrtiimonas chitiniclastica TaxID=400946 RepID=A0AB35BUU0_9GAMM|nr:restriction endonuclease subunit S [Wohlfahrtiimonas chitiniclastica]MBS7823592.1 restriction endonuclease subunit S [Wohlfahrtiimonas chitiniclastica]MBS7839210.1 restriction endonuclease subunit S [Wohlfahrtiimonas chitiniclastica]